MTRLLRLLAFGIVYGMLMALCGWGLDSVLRGFNVTDFNRGMLVGGTVVTMFQAVSEISRWKRARTRQS